MSEAELNVRRLDCGYGKKYKAKRKPRCECAMCVLKWERKQRDKFKEDLKEMRLQNLDEIFKSAEMIRRTAELEDMVRRLVKALAKNHDAVEYLIVKIAAHGMDIREAAAVVSVAHGMAKGALAEAAQLVPMEESE